MADLILPELLHGADYNYEQWLDYPEVLKRDFELMKMSNCNVMTVGIFSWAKLEPKEGFYDFLWLDELLDRLHENNMKAILSTPSGAKPVWLSKMYPEVCRVNKDGKREAHGFRHNHCRTSPVYREKSVKINSLLANRYKNHPALLMWHVSNEYNSGECYCEHCLNSFREWLKNRYKTIESLNKAWWTTFWSHTYSDWTEIDPVDPSVHGLMLDWQRFISDQTLDFFITESEPLRSITPDIPLTTNFMQPDVGLDYWSFAPYVSIVSWDNYPLWHRHNNEWKEGVITGFYHDLYRSLKDMPFMMMESSPNVTNWQGISIPKRKNMHMLSSIQAVAHGSDTVQYFQWRQSRGGEEKFHGAVVSHVGHENTRVFRDVTSVGDILKELQGVCGTSTESEVAIIYDFQNEWAINNAQFARNLDKNYQESCIDQYEAFWSMGISVDIKATSWLDFSKYKVIIAPMLYMLNNDFENKIKKFVLSGGTFVTTYMSGMVNESDLCYLGGAPGPLSDVLGIWVEDIEILNEQNTQYLSFENKRYCASHFADRVHLTDAVSLADFNGGALDGQPAITVNSYGRGSAYYIASRNDESFNSRFYSSLVEKCGLNREYKAPLPKGVTIQYRKGSDCLYIFVMNFRPENIHISTEGCNWLDAITSIRINSSVNIPGYGIKIFKRLIDRQ